ncbi:hypothetical protein QN277_002038 [Acacia crassicarpa]|uniref:Cytochrome P450 n=1 Tax=Acacia crassicarpa TaxID=499986 RepID=A0AAE1N9K6_9FABA|nr:hypothetical protein QN277_002038 [Acacia crassicarpa]
MKGVLMDIFVAGTDTSSATLVWAMAELIKNPDSMKKAQEEVRKVAKGKQMVEEEELGSLRYLKSVATSERDIETTSTSTITNTQRDS